MRLIDIWTILVPILVILFLITYSCGGPKYGNKIEPFLESIGL